MNFKIQYPKVERWINSGKKYSINFRLNLKTSLVWEKELTPMSVKSSVVGCFSNAIVRVPRNCLERFLNIAVIKNFRNDTFGKKYHTSAGSCFHIQLLSYNVVSKQKNKNENTEYHGMFISFKSHLDSKQGSPIFLLLDSLSLVLYLLVLVKPKFFR